MVDRVGKLNNAVVSAERSAESKQKATSSFVIWTEQSIISVPSFMACSYARSVQAGYTPLAPL